jgi:hypothetical protein
VPKPGGSPSLWNLLICTGMASWGSEPFSSPATVALPPMWPAARFGAQRKRADGGNHFRQGLNEIPVTRLRGAARNSELVDSLLERRSLHSKTCRRASGTGHNPIAPLKGLEDVCAFGFL